MPTPTVILGQPAADAADTHAVYLRHYWADEWTAAPGLWADEIVWSVAPQISTARLWWDYGYLQRQGEAALSEVAKLRSEVPGRYYVKIVQTFDAGQTSRTWYGVLEILEDQQGGSVTTIDKDDNVDLVATGEQQLTAYGLESLLELERIRASTFTRDGANSLECGRALTFNRAAEPNRSELAAFDASHVFSSDPTAADQWSSRDIVRYLLAHAAPTNSSGSVKVPYSLEDASEIVSTWDAPELEQRGRSLWSLLVSLMARQRLTSFTVEVAEHDAPTLDAVKLTPFTFVEASIVTALGGQIPANANQINLVIERDRTAAATLKTSTLDQYDKIVARGARRVSVFSVSDADATWEGGWSVIQEAAYCYACAGDAGYGALTLAEKQERNAEVRAGDALRDVYRRFVIPDNWDGQAGDGEGGAKAPVFPVGEHWNPGDTPAPFFDLDLAILPTIPLLEGVDYSGTKVRDGTVDTDAGGDEERPPFCAWKLPEAGRYQAVDTLGQKGDLEETDDKANQQWSASLRVRPDSRAIELTVHASPQHVLAFSDFNPLPVDDDCGEHDWRDAIFTIAVEDDRYAEGTYGGDASVDAERVLVIDAGPEYRLDFIARNTVVGVADDGTLQRATAAGFLRDDTDALHSIATVAGLWYTTPRKAIQLETENLTASLELGQMILNLGVDDGETASHYHEAVNTVITEIRVFNYRADGGDPQPSRIRITTGSSELDPMQLLGRPGESELAVDPEGGTIQLRNPMYYPPGDPRGQMWP